MRRALDALYDGCAWIAAVFMVLIFAIILVQIVTAEFHVYIRGTDAYARYAMAGASFFALAHTLKRGEHIRVTLVLEHLAPRWRHVAELWCHVAGTALSGVFAWFAWKMVIWAFTTNDVSTEEDRWPLWIPQSVMAIGVSVLCVAFADELVQVLRGRAPAKADELSRTE